MTGAGPYVPITAADVVAVTGGELVAGDPGRRFDGVTIDSRHVIVGQLFIGIRGDRFDGSEFAREGVESGATGVVIGRGSAGARKLGGHAAAPVVIVVDDTTAALQALGRHVRRASGAKVTAITGSAGKTTTKEVAADFLATRFTVYRNPGNLNNHIGLPLSLIDLRTGPQMAVVELGMNHAGEIRRLVSLAEPEMRVWTNVGDAHIGFFRSPDAIADAKAEILESADQATVVVANADDPRVASRVAGFHGRVVTFGRAEGAHVRATAVKFRGVDGTSAHLATPAGEADLEVPLAGEGNLANVLAATAVAVTWGVPLPAVIDCAARLRPARRRGEVIALGQGVTLVDDSYNSSPSALQAALRTLSRDARHGRRVAFLGEMLELGAHAAVLHEACGRAAAEAGLAARVAVGGDPAERLASAARDGGMPADAVRHLRTSEEAAAAADLITPGDLVLVKGSRAIRMDVVADRVREVWS